MSTTTQESKDRRALAFSAIHEIGKLAEFAKKVCEDDDHPIFHGLMSRIEALSEIVFHAQELGGANHGGPDLPTLERLFEGRLS